MEPAEICIVLIGADPLTAAGLQALLAADGLPIRVHRVDRPATLAELKPHLVLFHGDDLGDELPKHWEQAIRDVPRANALVITRSPAGDGADELPTIRVHQEGCHELAAVVRSLAEGTLRVPCCACRPSPPVGVSELTPRQQEIVSCLAEGLSHKQIAARLNLSVHTVRWHLRAMRERTRLRPRAAAKPIRS